MVKANYKLRDFPINFFKLVKIIWNDKIIYDDTLNYYDPCLASVEVLKDIRIAYINKTVYNVNMSVYNGDEIILTVEGEE